MARRFGSVADISSLDATVRLVPGAEFFQLIQPPAQRRVHLPCCFHRAAQKSIQRPGIIPSVLRVLGGGSPAMEKLRLTLGAALAADRLEDFVRQEEAHGVELDIGSDFERALALLLVQRGLSPERHHGRGLAVLKCAAGDQRS